MQVIGDLNVFYLSSHCFYAVVLKQDIIIVSVSVANEFNDQ